MSSYSHYDFQKTIYETLTADSALMNSIVGVFDRPAQGTAFPYVTIGESKVSDWCSKTTTGTTHEFVVHVWSREGGRRQSSDVMTKIYTLLHDADLTVEGQALILMRFEGSEITLMDDGFTYHGIMRFKALLEAL